MDLTTEKQTILELKKKLLKLNIDNGLGRLTDFSQIKKTKKKIAQALTKINAEAKRNKK